MTKKINYFYYLLIIFGLSIFILNFYDSIINGYFLISLHVLILFIFFILFRKIRSSKYIYVYISIASVSGSILLFDAVNYYFLSMENNYDMSTPTGVVFIEDDYFSGGKARIYSKNYPSGYLVKDGKYKAKRSYIKEGKTNKIFEVEYNILNGFRVGSLNKVNNFCSDVILLGGSHNFGWGLDFDYSLQGKIENKGFSTLNLSIPGFGLSNSLALLIEKENEQNCMETQKENTYFIYRAIPDHVNRNVGKTSLNIYGPNFFNQDSNETFNFEPYCNRWQGCLTYLTKYFITRLSYYLITSQYERSSNIIGNLINSNWRYKEDDFIKTNKLVNLLVSYGNKNYRDANFLVLIDDGSTKHAVKLYNQLKQIASISIILVGGDVIYYSSNDKTAKYNTAEMIKKYCNQNKKLSMRYDYHPTACHNSIIFQIINERFIL